MAGPDAGAERPEDLTYEQAVAELEEIVAKLERGEISLDASLGLFERGVALMRAATALLDAAERRVDLLTLDASGRPVLRPLPGTDEGRPA